MVSPQPMEDVKRWVRRHPVLTALVFLSAFGVYALADAIRWVLLIPIGIALALAVLARVSKFMRALALVLGTIAVPWLCLLGFNVLVEWLPVGSPGLELGFVVGVAVFAAVATGMLVLWRERLRIAIPIAAALSLLNVGGLPVLLGAREPQRTVAAPQRLVSELDAVIIVPGRTGDDVEANAAAPSPYPDWRVRYAVARTDDSRLRWLTLGTDDPAVAHLAALGDGPSIDGTPPRRPGADRLVMLNVDGIPPVTPRPWQLPERDGTRGEVEHWMAIVDQAVPKSTPIVALLQSTDRNRKKRWERAMARRGGFAVSAQRLRARSITEAALLAAVELPGADETLSLAVRFRPVLLFDSGARLDAPLDVDVLLRSGRVKLCHDDHLDGSTDCDELRSAASLVNGATHLRLPRSGTSQGIPTRIYVHPVNVRAGDRELLYLDYWWYLDTNPNKVGRGAFCGAGLALPGVSCFKHDSDWEGVTVVVQRTASDAVPVAVQYAQHSDVLRYRFDQLRDLDWRTARVRRVLDTVGLMPADVVDRPLVFVAAGSHASYPTPCRVVTGCVQRAHPNRGEDRHDGRARPTWSGNDTNRCIAKSCVRLTPTRDRGTKPALWNAYEGAWGERRCILRAYCTAEAAPAAPASQRRYKHPERITGYVDARGRYRSCDHKIAKGKNACPPPPVAH